MKAAKAIPTLTEKDKARFWSKVDKSAGPDGCWIWIGGKFSSGYGQAWIGKNRFRAHRIAFVVSGGIFEDSKELVCHGPCNNQLCCNPSHLGAGDSKSNMDDKKRDGTAYKSISGDAHYSRSKPEKMARGEGHGNSRLQESSVRKIRQQYSAGRISYRNLGKQFGVSASTIERVVNRHLWNHVV